MNEFYLVFEQEYDAYYESPCGIKIHEIFQSKEKAEEYIKRTNINNLELKSVEFSDSKYPELLIEDTYNVLTFHAKAFIKQNTETIIDGPYGDIEVHKIKNPVYVPKKVVSAHTRDATVNPTTIHRREVFEVLIKLPISKKINIEVLKESLNDHADSIFQELLSIYQNSNNNELEEEILAVLDSHI
jgi:hypothetical protein